LRAFWTSGALGSKAIPSASPLPEKRLPSRAGEAWQSATVLQQQARGTDRAGGEDQSWRLDAAVLAIAEVLERDGPGAARARRRHDLLGEMQGPHLRTVFFGSRHIGDVDGVPRVYGTADVAAAEVLAALLPDAAEGVLAGLAEVDGERQQLRLLADVTSRGGEGTDLRQRRIVRCRPRLQRLLGAVVPGVERLAVERCRPVSIEDVGRRPQLHVGVDKRAAADPRGGDHRDVSHHPYVEETFGIERLVPEHLRRLRGLIGKSPQAAKRRPRSNTQTRFPASANRQADMPPPKPEPITTAS